MPNIVYGRRRGLRHGYSVELSPLARIAATARRSPEDLYRLSLAAILFFATAVVNVVTVLFIMTLRNVCC